MINVPEELKRVFPLLDASIVLLAGWIAYLLRWRDVSPADHYALAMALGTLFTLVLLPATGAYQSWRGRDHSLEFGNALPGLAGVFVGLMAAATASKTTADFSRLWMAYWVMLSVALAALLRGVLALALQRARIEATRVLVIGTDRLAIETTKRLQSSETWPCSVIGMVHVGEEPPPSSLPAPLLGSSHSLGALLDTENPDFDEIWLASSHLSEESRSNLVAQLRASCVTVRYVPDLWLLDLLGHVPAEVAGMTVIELNASPLNGSGALVKACVDRAGAALLLVVLAPLLILTALAIRIDSPGPVLFRQKRHGGLGNVIEVYKFRTMRHEPGAGYRQATRGDPRVTRLGGFLRRTSIDELPQLFNVLRGDMSLVGPRPHPVELNLEFTDKIDAYMQRHRVKPGITGWAQVHGYRGETDTVEKMAQRVAHDLYYIENWSLWLDIRILLMTAFGAWTGRNAY